MFGYPNLTVYWTYAAAKAPVVATGNVGCAMHIQSEADARGQNLRVVHPVELLHRAAFGDAKSR